MLVIEVELNKNGLRVELTVPMPALIAAGGTLLAIMAKMVDLI